MSAKLECKQCGKELDDICVRFSCTQFVREYEHGATARVRQEVRDAGIFCATVCLWRYIETAVCP